MATTETIETASGQYWNGSYVTGPTATPTGVLVKYHGPTDHRGSRYVAVLRRPPGEGHWRFAVSYQQGPLVAVAGLLERHGLPWRIDSIAYVDSDTYCVTVTPKS